MKKLSQKILESRKNPLEIQDDTLNYVSAEELKKYLEIADKFICDESRELIQYLIVNNKNYINDLAPDGEENALAYFYNNGPYEESHLMELYSLIGKINKQHKLLEIPVFQTREQLVGIINKEFSLDEVIIDLDSPQGRNAVAKKYENLCYKIALSFNGKSNLQFDDLLAAAHEGLVWAMNEYCKKSKKAIRREERTGEKIDEKQFRNTTFLTFASYMIRFAIFEAIKNESHLVHIPVNKQAEERKEKGYNSKNNEISGDRKIGDDENSKSLFDFISDTENAGKDVDDQDIKMVWDMLMRRLKSTGNFSEKMINAWINFNQLNGNEKRKNKDIAEELGISPSNVTYYCYCINNFIKTDPEMRKIAKELISLFNESLQRYYEENDKEEPKYIKLNETDNNICE